MDQQSITLSFNQQTLLEYLVWCSRKAYLLSSKGGKPWWGHLVGCLFLRTFLLLHKTKLTSSTSSFIFRFPVPMSDTTKIPWSARECPWPASSSWLPPSPESCLSKPFPVSPCAESQTSAPFPQSGLWVFSSLPMAMAASSLRSLQGFPTALRQRAKALGCGLSCVPPPTPLLNLPPVTRPLENGSLAALGGDALEAEP